MADYTSGQTNHYSTMRVFHYSFFQDEFDFLFKLIFHNFDPLPFLGSSFQASSLE